MYLFFQQPADFVVLIEECILRIWANQSAAVTVINWKFGNSFFVFLPVCLLNTALHLVYVLITISV